MALEEGRLARARQADGDDDEAFLVAVDPRPLRRRRRRGGRRRQYAPPGMRRGVLERASRERLLEPRLRHERRARVDLPRRVDVVGHDDDGIWRRKLDAASLQAAQIFRWPMFPPMIAMRVPAKHRSGGAAGAFFFFAIEMPLAPATGPRSHG